MSISGSKRPARPEVLRNAARAPEPEKRDPTEGVDGAPPGGAPEGGGGAGGGGRAPPRPEPLPPPLPFATGLSHGSQLSHSSFRSGRAFLKSSNLLTAGSRSTCRRAFARRLFPSGFLSGCLLASGRPSAAAEESHNSWCLTCKEDTERLRLASWGGHFFLTSVVRHVSPAIVADPSR